MSGRAKEVRMAKIRETPAAYATTPDRLTIVTQRGQTTIPHELRQRYGVQAKSRLRWIDTGRGMLVVPVSDDPIKAARGMLGNKDTSTQAFLVAKREELQLEEPGK